MRTAPLSLLLCLACGASSTEPKTAPLAGKNVLVILVDACATDHLGFMGYERNTTPYLGQLAEEGIVFEDVTSAAPYTIASVASLMTGEAVDLHGVTEAGDVVSDNLPMLAERFQEAGYQTAAFSANAHIQERFGFGRGFDEFHGYWPKLQETHHVPEQQRKQAAAFLERAAKDPRPFFSYVHLLPPHAPYDPPMPARRRFAGYLANTDLDSAGALANLTPLSRAARVPGPAEDQAIRDLYDASLEHVDSVIHELTTKLDELELTDDTLIVILSDHGEAFGQHGLWQHARTVYQEMVRVPLVLKLPVGTSLAPQARIPEPVALIDLNPTLIDLFALPGPRPFSATSLAGLLPGSRDTRPTDRPPIVTRTAGPREHIAVREGHYKLTHQLAAPGSGAPGIWQFFDLAEDPSENAPIATADEAKTPEQEAAYRRLRRALKALRADLKTRAQAANKVEVDQETESHLGDIGYGEK